nr:PREDICTED: BMP-binding endothelial regulator protein [Bemisia tabaci]
MFVFYIILILFGCLPVMPDAESISGTIEVCSNEGELVNLNYGCFTCICKNGFVQCQKDPCPGQEGCHMLLGETTTNCSSCFKCKGCLHHDSFYESGTEWRDKSDPCTVLTCKAGVVTESEIQCYTPCKNPLPPGPGQCCPTCPDCRINGQEVRPGHSVAILDDPCLRCRCESTSRRMVCEKRSCPVLHCLTSPVKNPGDCCPRCNGSRHFVEPPKGQCLLNNELHPAGHSFEVDRCTVCSCLNATTVCKRKNCPALDCPPSRQSFVHGRQCCPRCLDLPKSTECIDHGRTYQNGAVWQVDACKSCACMDGQVKCAQQTCPQLNTPCPPNSKLIHDPGQCCPRCVDSDGVCTVFGDPHYRTFDGKFYNFQGACKYLLAADCVNNTFHNSSFQIRVINDARNTKTSSWTKIVTIKLRELGIKVYLGRRMRVKINKKNVTLPHIIENKIKVTRTNDSVLLETKIGLRVLWDGNSFLEVAVSPHYRGRLCGLCGNFNKVARDDLTTRSGRLLHDDEAFAEVKFGESWRVGTTKACSRPPFRSRFPAASTQPCHLTSKKPIKDKYCRHLLSNAFTACHSKLLVNPYMKSCVQDMCECPKEKCYCESFIAYAHECERLGVRLPNWRHVFGCPPIQSTSKQR